MIERLTRRLASSYRRRLAVGYVAVIALLAAAWLASLFGPLTDAVTNQQRAHLASVARADAVALAESSAPAADLARRLGERDLRVTIVAADGTVLADSGNDAATMENHADRPEIAAALAGRVGSDVRRSHTEGVDRLYVAVPATYHGSPAAVRASESLASVGALAAQSRFMGLALLAAALVLSAFVTARLAGTAAAPVARLADAAHAIARGETREVPHEDGELGVVSDALADLAQQVRQRIAEAEAEQSDLRAVLDGLDDAVLLIDGDVVRFANRATSRVFREPFGGWRGLSLAEAGLPASVTAAVAAAPDGERMVRELGPDPLGRSLRLSVTPLGLTAHDVPRTLVVVSDVSERVRLDAVRRDFVANASHELKTPAAAIQLLAESAAAAEADGDGEQARAFVAQMRAEADRLRGLVRDLLDLSRLEQTPPPGAVTDVRSAVELALTAHRASAEAKGLLLAADLGPIEAQDVFVTAGATDVAIALDNLLANAVAYTESGEVRIRVLADADAVSLEVSDTGTGIPADALPRVFERFFRVDKARSRDSGGTGLGLALVRHVVERAGGSVSIESELGAGTTVTIALPRAS